jgi:acyl-CoA reductase-like NAD-dependent aldehyde dehydrogenase
LVGRLRNLTDFKRVEHLLSSTKGSIVWGGKSTESRLFVEPTVVKDVPEANDPLIDSELFAPILPVIRYRDTLHAKALLRRLSPDPLAFYVFSEDLDEANALVNAARSGTAAINDVLAQIAPTNLPFGGVGRSGFGTYRGKASIDTFSQKQSIVTMATVPEAEQMLDWRYPYNESPETVIAVRSAMLAKLD